MSASANTTIIANQILSNNGASIEISTSGVKAYVGYTFISGNLVKGNKIGLTVSPSSPGGVYNTTVIKICETVYPDFPRFITIIL